MGLSPVTPLPPPSIPSPLPGRKFSASAFFSGFRRFRDGQASPDHLQFLSGRLIRQVQAVDDVWLERLCDLNDRKTLLGSLLDVQVLLAALSLEEDLANGNSG